METDWKTQKKHEAYEDYVSEQIGHQELLLRLNLIEKTEE